MDGATYTKLCEGLTLTAEKDTRGWSIGYGHNSPDIGPDTVWSRDTAESVFAQDYAQARIGAEAVVGSAWSGLNEVRRAALTDMAYEMGVHGLAGFANTIAHVVRGQWQAAHDGVLLSAYAREVPERSHRTAFMLLTGQWPAGYGRDEDVVAQ